MVSGGYRNPIVKFKDGKAEEFTIVLCTRDYRKLGQLTGITNLHYASHDNSPNEISFSLTKNKLICINGNTPDDIELYMKLKRALWEEIVDFKVIWVQELNEYFEIKVTVSDSVAGMKTITGTPVPESELSQILLTAEINTEDDIARPDYEVTTFYNEENHNASLLHRVLSKATGYTIKYVDDSLKDLQRMFSISDSTIYDFLIGECSEQFNCVFKFDSSDRSIWVYDLYYVCSECGTRMEAEADKCPKCECTSFKHYGDNTTIYIDKDNLSDEITLEVNTDNIKNCFKLVAGDEYMTATVIGLNPSGSDCIYHIPEYLKRDMPTELVKKLEEYDELYSQYVDRYEQLTEERYDLEDKIAYLADVMMPTVEDVDVEPTLETIADPKQGVLYVYNKVVYLFNGSDFEPQLDDEGLYSTLTSTFISAGDEARKLTQDKLSPLGLFPLTTSTSLATVNSAARNLAKVFVKTGYVKVEVDEENSDYKPTFTFNTFINDEKIKEVELDENGYHFGTWKGRFKITNYSDKEQVAYSDMITLKVYDNYQDFAEQKIFKNMTQDDEDGNIFDVLSIGDIGDFQKAIKLYCRDRLKSFYDAIQLALDTLCALGHGDETADLYEPLYVPYRQKLDALHTVCGSCGTSIGINDTESNYSELATECPKCNSTNLIYGEFVIRQNQIAELQRELDIKKNEQAEIREILDFEKYLGDYYSIFSSYRRESVYSNDNFSCDGLSNGELITRAKEFIALAKEELYKSSERQIVVSSSLHNLLLIPEFKPLVDKFQTGNIIRVNVDGIIYKPRLLSFSVDFNNKQTLSVEFSNTSHSSAVTNEMQSILESAKTMGQTYGYVAKQAEKGGVAKDNIQGWINHGLNTALVKLKNNDNEEVTYGKHGLLCRSYDDISGTFSPKQLKLTHNTIAFTDNNWNSVKTAIGENVYISYNPSNNKWEELVGYGLTSQYVMSGVIYGENEIIGGMIRSKNYSDGKTLDKDGHVLAKGGSYIDLNTGEFSFGGDSIYYRNGDFVINETVIGTAIETIEIKAENLRVDAGNIDGLLQAEQINVTDLHVNAGNVDGEFVAKTIIGGQIYSLDYKSNQYNPTTHIDLDNGEFSFAKGHLTYNQNDGLVSNQLTINSLFGEESHIEIKFIMDASGENYDGFSLKYSLEEDVWENLLGVGLINSRSGQHGITIGNVCGDMNVFGNITPFRDGGGVLETFDLGSSNKRWKNIYAVTGTIQTSDRNEKREISEISDAYEKLFLSLYPVSYKFNNGERTHVGFIAQDVENSMRSANLNNEDFAALCIDNINNTNQYGLRYDEFIALNTHMIQKLYRRVKSLEDNISK